MALRLLLYLALGAQGTAFVRRWIAADPAGTTRPTPTDLLVGFATDFFDTLGIGSFAPTTTLFRWLGSVSDELIPGTLIVGHALPTIAQAVIFITIIAVDLPTLVLLIGASVLGAWLGAGVVASWPRRRVRLGMGAALLVAAALFLASALGMLPAGGDAIALRGGPLAVGLLGNGLFGALMTIGIGAYAPSLILFGLLGMNLKAVFPVMMGSCAFLMPAGGLRFLRARRIAGPAALGLALGGVPGVLCAAFLVREMPITWLRWLVIGIVTATAIGMLRAAWREPD